jgi:hypothetical protein
VCPRGAVHARDELFRSTAAKLAPSWPHARTLDRGARRQGTGGGQRPARSAARSITWPGVRAARAVGSHPRCTTGHLVWWCRPRGQMIPAPNPDRSATPVRRDARPCVALHAVALGLPSRNVRFAPDGRRSCTPKRRPGGGWRNLPRANAIPGRPGRRSRRGLQTSSSRCAPRIRAVHPCAIEHSSCRGRPRRSVAVQSCSGTPLVDGTDACCCSADQARQSAGNGMCAPELNNPAANVRGSFIL